MSTTESILSDGQQPLQLENRTQVIVWLRDTYTHATTTSVSKRSVFGHYLDACKRQGVLTPISHTYFGKLVRKAFPDVRCNRKGPRGSAQQHYRLIRADGGDNDEFLSACPDTDDDEPDEPPVKPARSSSSKRNGGSKKAATSASALRKNGVSRVRAAAASAASTINRMISADQAPVGLSESWSFSSAPSSPSLMGAAAGVAAAASGGLSMQIVADQQQQLMGHTLQLQMQAAELAAVLSMPSSPAQSSDDEYDQQLRQLQQQDELDAEMLNEAEELLFNNNEDSDELHDVDEDSGDDNDDEEEEEEDGDDEEDDQHEDSTSASATISTVVSSAAPIGTLSYGSLPQFQVLAPGDESPGASFSYEVCPALSGHDQTLLLHRQLHHHHQPQQQQQQQQSYQPIVQRQFHHRPSMLPQQPISSTSASASTLASTVRSPTSASGFEPSYFYDFVSPDLEMPLSAINQVNLAEDFGWSMPSMPSMVGRHQQQQLQQQQQQHHLQQQYAMQASMVQRPMHHYQPAASSPSMMMQPLAFRPQQQQCSSTMQQQQEIVSFLLADQLPSTQCSDLAEWVEHHCY